MLSQKVNPVHLFKVDDNSQLMGLVSFAFLVAARIEVNRPSAAIH
jgi:hypothetical protein